MPELKTWKKEDILRLSRDLEEKAKEMLEDSGVHHPTAFAFGVDRKLNIIGMAWPDELLKRVALQMLYASRWTYDAVLIVSEMWHTKLPGPTTAAEAKKRYLDETGDADHHPEAKEGLGFWLGMADGTRLFRAWPFRREKNRIVWEEVEESSGEIGGTYYDIFKDWR